MWTGFEGASIESSPSWTVVNRSNRLYFGIYSVTFTMDNIRNKIESYLTHEEWNKDLKNEGWLQSQRIDMQKEIQDMLEVQRKP